MNFIDRIKQFDDYFKAIGKGKKPLSDLNFSNDQCDFKIEIYSNKFKIEIYTMEGFQTMYIENSQAHLLMLFAGAFKNLKRERKPDLRLNWRDPNMPVLRLNERRQMVEVKPEFISNYYDKKINSLYYNAPSWRNDETYDLKGKRK